MNTLTLHIEYLLRLHDCVIVPTLGAFIISRCPARFDREAGVILPPSADLTFNPSVTHNDGLLATSIARRAGIDYDSAVEILDEQVAALRAHLSVARTITLGSLGTLTLGAEDNPVFTPARRQTERYGLHQVLLPRLAPAPQAGEGVEIQPAVVTPAETPERKERRFSPEKYYYIPVHKMFAKVSAVIVAVVLLVAGFVNLSPGADDATRRDCASVIPVPMAKPAPVKVAEPQPALTDTTAQYHVVVGTFTSKDEAARFMARHAADGFDLKSVEGRRYTRITAARSHDRDAMVSVLRSAAIDSCFNNAWIWKN